MIRLTLLFFSCTVLVAQPNPTDKSQLNQFYDLALLHGHSYEWLDYLTKNP